MTPRPLFRSAWRWARLGILTGALELAGGPVAPAAPASEFAALDDLVRQLMQQARVPGLALALIRQGQVVHVQSFGVSDAQQDRALQRDDVMYGASLTKAAFAHLVMQLVDEGRLDLDTPLPALLAQPLPRYPGYADLAGDERWRQLTLRQLLSHQSGLLNWRWINPDERLDFKFDPGTRYVYSGEGIQLAQLVVEERTGRSVGAWMQERVFDRFGMRNSSMTWRPDFAGRAVAGHRNDGSVRAHVQRSRPRAAGSMDTTVGDAAAFLAAVLRGEGLSPAAQQAMLAPQIAIVSPQQFPSHWGGSTAVNAPIGLAAGLGWVVYRSPQGPAFFKEGNDEGTNNLALGFAATGDGLVLLSNSANADRLFFPLVEHLWGPSCLPWFWMGYIPHDQGALRASGAREAPLGPGAACLAGLPRERGAP